MEKNKTTYYFLHHFNSLYFFPRITAYEQFTWRYKVIIDINFPQMTRTVPINIITSFLNTWIENETAYFPTNTIVWLSQKHFTNRNSKATNKLHSNYCYFVSQSHDNHENELKRVRYNKKGKILKRVLLEFKEGFNGWRRNSRTNKNNQISLYSVIQFRCSQRLTADWKGFNVQFYWLHVFYKCYEMCALWLWIISAVSIQKQRCE